MNKELYILCNPFANNLLNSITMSFAPLQFDNSAAFLSFTFQNFLIKQSEGPYYFFVFHRSVTKINSCLMKPTDSRSENPTRGCSKILFPGPDLLAVVRSSKMLADLIFFYVLEFSLLREQKKLVLQYNEILIYYFAEEHLSFFFLF